MVERVGARPHIPAVWGYRGRSDTENDAHDTPAHPTHVDSLGLPAVILQTERNTVTPLHDGFHVNLGEGLRNIEIFLRIHINTERIRNLIG